MMKEDFAEGFFTFATGSVKAEVKGPFLRAFALRITGEQSSLRVYVETSADARAIRDAAQSLVDRLEEAERSAVRVGVAS